MIQITIEVSDELEDALGKGASEKIAETAFQEWADWFFGRRRPINQVELEVPRVRFLYLKILHDLPSANHLSSLLKFTPGHSNYLYRSLLLQSDDNDKLELRKRLIEAILQAVQKAKPNKEDGFQDYLIKVPPECKSLIDEELSKLLEEEEEEITGTRKGDLVWYYLGEGHCSRLREALEKELNNK